MNHNLLTTSNDEDKPLVLDAIQRLGDQAYGSNIHSILMNGTTDTGGKYLPLETLYDLIFDLIEEGIVTSQKIELEAFNGWRKLFSLTQTSSPVQES